MLRGLVTGSNSGKKVKRDSRMGKTRDGLQARENLAGPQMAGRKKICNRKQALKHVKRGQDRIGEKERSLFVEKIMEGMPWETQISI